ncbi:hypothetical protein GCM10009819_16430 [Agromyces tropicus]|uniref:MarR family transcriptional regulator n=1 Tax=Agromyces tropicus TaxID=555371 RepID=A0ABP5FUE7_9MICO
MNTDERFDTPEDDADRPEDTGATDTGAPDTGATGDTTGAADASEPSHGRSASDRPLGFWLKTVDRLIAAEVEAALADLDVTRRDWRRLNLVAGEVRDEHLLTRLDARPHKLDDLVERGWVAGGPGDWSLTDAGREALDRLTDRVGRIRARVAGTVTEEDFATTVASLEAIARELGWDASAPEPSGRGPRGARFGDRRGPWAGRAWSGRRGMPPWFAEAPQGGPRRHPDRGDERGDRVRRHDGPWGHDHRHDGPWGREPWGHEHPGHPRDGHAAHEHGDHPHRGRGRGRGRREDVHVHVHVHHDGPRRRGHDR